jgi:hypothetical protein
MTAPSHDQHYGELTRRNAGFISPATQQALRGARVLVAGCGSTGGAAVEPLVRLGVEHLDLADNGTFELDNLNRQPADDGDVGRNKAAVAKERALAINPFAEILAEPLGVTAANVDALVAPASVIVDGVDVTGRSGWRAKLALHEAAVAHGRPVITGYDMAGRQYVRFYDYRRAGSRAFDGRILSRHVEELGTWAVLSRAVPLRRVPVEMLQEARAHLGNPEHSVPQLVYASLIFGALTARIVSEVVGGGRIRREIVVDVHRAVRTPTGRMRSTGRHATELVAAARDVVRLRRGGRSGVALVDASAAR